jgi:hypothetical protein
LPKVPILLAHLLFLVTGSLLLSGTAFDFRPPTEQEQKVLDKYSNAIDKILSQFKDEDWEENVDQSLANAEVNPNSDQPLTLDSFVQRTYDVRGSSERYKQMVLPLVKSMVQSSDLEEKKELNQQIQDLMHVQVQVRLNRLWIPLIPTPQENKDLQIEGATLAYKIKNDAYSSGTAYVLLFGDARALEWDPERNAFRYKFANAGGAPAIENVEFRIYGAEDHIQQLLHSIDWRRANDALTP